jgi:hypothetical protein
MVCGAYAPFVISGRFAPLWATFMGDIDAGDEWNGRGEGIIGLLDCATTVLHCLLSFSFITIQ